MNLDRLTEIVTEDEIKYHWVVLLGLGLATLWADQWGTSILFLIGAVVTIAYLCVED